ncbi:hypothetical protein [Sporosarcina sp. HYO08]|uniref:hypothetical protein n=1 Tax=Sporosarcina sp. HYO08 TaxID=1759557 RepID=UPI0007918CC5|nr:hypothetical protein [Sporosarcina sp. HYO08]KXH87155.1 hypothetical protein AU377_00855 [Sporosarcina sp. HYO08]
MFRKWKFILLLLVSSLLLTACGQTLEEQVHAGIEAARNTFTAGPKEQTAEIDGIQLYKPAGYVIAENSDAQNIVFTKNDETFILFINPNEENDSRLFFDLLKADTSKEIIESQTFTDNGLFGFAAVVESGEDEIELIASVGGAKMTTMANKKKIEENLTKMMEIVRSIKEKS